MGITITTALVMGFSASLSCMAWCVPVIVPYTGAGEKSSLKSGFITSLLFSIGRLFSYAGLLAIFLAMKAIFTLSPVITLVAGLTSGIIMILSGLASMGILPWNNRIGRLVCRQAAGNRSPFYLGLLTGLRPCGPLLAAIAFAITLSETAYIAAFILFFWIASSLLVLVLGAAGGQVFSFIGGRIGSQRLHNIVGTAMVIIGLFLILQTSAPPL
ncbi:MAG: hypothetical protein A4E53_00680 [Pelotomaculum sp. PtaB.Bin104]|nr:MAG: hypothetical protein A4E53_00680 [Pelotomaculum sp. PtaB.Bin104]